MKNLKISDETYEKIKDQLVSEEIQKENPKVEIGKYALLRTYSAGVHLGILEKRDGKDAELTKAIRIFYWDGAASLSQLAMEGTKHPENCKFAVPVSHLVLTDVIEYLAVTKVALSSIQGTPSWKK
jgi:hypothetical protein